MEKWNKGKWNNGKLELGETGIKESWNNAQKHVYYFNFSVFTTFQFSNIPSFQHSTVSLIFFFPYLNISASFNSGNFLSFSEMMNSSSGIGQSILISGSL